MATFREEMMSPWRFGGWVSAFIVQPQRGLTRETFDHFQSVESARKRREVRRRALLELEAKCLLLETKVALSARRWRGITVKNLALIRAATFPDAQWALEQVGRKIKAEPEPNEGGIVYTVPILL